MNESLPKGLTIESINMGLARQKHLDFVRYCWQRKDEPFIVGRHITSICDRIDRAILDFRDGKSSFIVFIVPPRHGKTTILSHMLPPHFLGMFPDKEVLAASHSQDFANALSKKARGILKSQAYRKLYPGICISQESSAKQEWSLQDHQGTTFWTGVGGGTGRGYSLGILDDYIRNPEDAQSEIIREKQWEWFQDTFMSRRAPVSITLLLVTRWHVDDIVGRIERINNPNHADYNSDFAKFEVNVFPAEAEDGSFLFPERFPDKYYQSFKVNEYSWSSMFQGRPYIRGGNMFKVDRIKVIDKCPDLSYSRAWDLASTEKEVNKSDPDWTAGALVATETLINEAKVPFQKVYVKNILKFRYASPERDRMIIQTAMADGPTVRIAIETSGGYLDTYNNLSNHFQNARTIQRIDVQKDKVVRAEGLMQVVEAGNLFIERGDWNAEFIAEMSAFPNGKHDDQVDTCVHAFNCQKRAMNFSKLGPITWKRKDDLDSPSSWYMRDYF